MCIICVSRSGIRQPDERTLHTMFKRNPDGAGYMVARDGAVHIHKGFMEFDDFMAAVRTERFTTQDSVVYHFRISTQAGINPEMTHPFPLSNQLHAMRALDVTAQCGVAHNGIIRLTSDPGNKLYSDTALFIAEYLSRMVNRPRDVRNRTLMNRVFGMAQSKFAIMDASGYVATVGEFINEHGLLFSNCSYSFTADRHGGNCNAYFHRLCTD